MVWSSWPTMNQEGMVSHAGGPDGCWSAARSRGRCVAAITAVVAGSMSAAKASWKTSALMYASNPASAGSVVEWGRTVRFSGTSMLPGNLYARSLTASPSAGANPLM